MIFEITLVFDTDGVDEDTGDVMPILRQEDVELYADNINIDTARAMVGYQGYRVRAIERGPDGYDTDQALADLRRISATLAGFEGDDEAQGMAADLNQVGDWFASGQFE